MGALTRNEAIAYKLLHELYAGAPVPTFQVRERAIDRYGIGYLDRALRGLVDKGRVEKPKRGHWVPRSPQR